MTNHGRIRHAALFMLLALGAELLSFVWKHPLSVYVFGVVGALLVVLSVGSLLLSLVSRPVESVERQEQAESERDEEDEGREAVAG
jgi:membrane protein implicated in regulation of membrane protease activity